MGYILYKEKVMKISENRKYKGYCSQNCNSSYIHQGELFCGPFCDEANKRLEECYEAEKPIIFLKENGYIKSKEEIKDEYKLRWGYFYKFKGFTYKKGKIFVCIIGETNSKEEYPQEYFDWKDLEKRANSVMKKTIISNNTNYGDIIVKNSSIGKTIINGKTYDGKNIKISNNKIFIDNKLVDKVLNNKEDEKDLFQDLEDRGIGYLGVLELLIKEIESYDDKEILEYCLLPSKTWEETKKEYISYYTEDKFESYWLWVAIVQLSNNFSEGLKKICY